MKTGINNLRQVCFVIVCIMMGVMNGFAQQTYSQLWGKAGEKWNKAKIPDFTNAGYKQGKETIPEYPVSVNVADFGAVGNGTTDNTEAFRKAIKKCKNKGAVYIPEGNYLLLDRLVISKSNICIKGAGQGKTILSYRKGLEELYPEFNTTFKGQTAWSWSGALILFNGDIAGSGIQDLSILFPDSLYAGHDFHERAYNGIGFSEMAHDGWARNITITGADLGFWVERTAHHITLEKWVFDFGANRAAQKISGHHALNIYGGYNLVQDFELKGRFVHDLSVESDKSVYNVFHNGKGMDLCIDHHNHDQRYNLFSNLDAGLGYRLYVSGGVATPRGICFNETFWNIAAKNPLSYCDQFSTKDAFSQSNVCVGIKTNKPSALDDPNDNWFETIDPAKLFPADLYLAQMQLKK